MKTRKYDCGKDEKMETEKMITGEVDTLRLEVNDDGEYIMISADDATMFDRFVAGIRQSWNCPTRRQRRWKRSKSSMRGRLALRRT